MTNEVRVYDIATDEVVPVTQEWCDNMQRGNSSLAAQRRVAKWVLELHPLRDKEQIDAMNKTALGLGAVWS